MKYGLLTFRECINLGDEIQSIAAKQFLPRVDYYIDRDHTEEHKGKAMTKVIMNGWYMNRPQNWPPPENIIPLFISFHLSNANKSNKILLEGENLNYFKKYEPIGCRDYNTLKLFHEKGIDAYFSGCITLTLKNNFNKRNNKIISVDTFYKLGNSLQKRLYKSLFPSEIYSEVEFIEQDRPQLKDSKSRFKAAQEFLDELAQAKLVITSRIHTALPCLAFGTPVVFVNVGFEDQTRLKGLIELMHQIKPNDIKYVKFTRFHRIIRILNLDKLANRKLSTKIDWTNPQKNSADIKSITNKISKTIKDFIND